MFERDNVTKGDHVIALAQKSIMFVFKANGKEDLI